MKQKVVDFFFGIRSKFLGNHVHRETKGLEGGVSSLGVEGQNYGVGGEM